MTGRKYDRLKDYLTGIDNDTIVIKMHYDELEKIIQSELPQSAYKHRTWWANGGHIQADAWLEAGWKVDAVEMGQFVVFEKTATQERSVQIGSRYKHYKGTEYIVLLLAKNSETLEKVVVYQDRYDASKVWVRPLAMFSEKVEIDGKFIDRFEEIPENSRD
ncbi:DUF1653 domain-containing protein [Dethiobacter alkaliphilus]|uniref:Uncharacterized protein n=1 Tax=Dethiobacter alkaliphilus AHT 1 TaxID=555088 RepID=C0GD48_DETAL|nr:DUF1653 domain-containing protein [Dethiobacter alkaliphilus]EEG79133.1 protein of unknown function DUF1653 [Dethiobacter alkaliphilus AHT 1]